jgi:serine/threonine protein phosphatase PrpC
MAKKQPTSTSGFRSYALSDQGVRGNNEDLVHTDDERGIYFVIDGMGGHAAGEQAAKIADERLRGRLERATGTPQQRIREAIALANNAIFESAEQHPDQKGMACVLTVALIDSDSATVGHVGDSRLYKVREASPGAITLSKITRDHSPVGELEDSRQITEAEAMAHPRRNEVFRDVGSTMRDPGDADFIDIYTISAEPDSGLLICSDGLTDALPLADIERVLREQVTDWQAAARTLIAQAKNHEAKDNISVVLVQGPEFGRIRRPRAAKENVVSIDQTTRDDTTPTQIFEEPAPSRRSFGRPILWMVLGAALGAGLFLAAQKWLTAPPQAPPKEPTKTATGAATIIVNPLLPGAQPDIAAALAVANEGDTIELAPGIYDNPIRIEKSNLLIDGSGAMLRPKPTADGSDGIVITGAAGVRIQNLGIAGDDDGDLSTGIRIVNSQVTLRNVHVTAAAGAGIEASGSSTLNMDGSSARDGSGPGLIVRAGVTATVKYSQFVANGRDPGDKQPGILLESSVPAVLIGNTIANNGGPAIVQPDPPTQAMLLQNLFSLDGRNGRPDDVRVTRKRARK